MVVRLVRFERGREGGRSRVISSVYLLCAQSRFSSPLSRAPPTLRSDVHTEGILSTVGERTVPSTFCAQWRRRRRLMMRLACLQHHHQRQTHPAPLSPLPVLPVKPGGGKGGGCLRVPLQSSPLPPPATLTGVRTGPATILLPPQPLAFLKYPLEFIPLAPTQHDLPS